MNNIVNRTLGMAETNMDQASKGGLSAGEDLRRRRSRKQSSCPESVGNVAAYERTAAVVSLTCASDQ